MSEISRECNAFATGLQRVCNHKRCAAGSQLADRLYTPDAKIIAASEGSIDLIVKPRFSNSCRERGAICPESSLNPGA
jgi:hypothetical protein